MCSGIVRGANTLKLILPTHPLRPLSSVTAAHNTVISFGITTQVMIKTFGIVKYDVQIIVLLHLMSPQFSTPNTAPVICSIPQFRPSCIVLSSLPFWC
jgi:hypothetical protein